MSSNSALQSRPPLQLAIGALDPMQQNHLQIALRVVSSKMRVPCVAVLEKRGEIVFEPSPVEKHVRLSTAAGNFRDLEQPVRLVPLSDALGELIETIINPDNGGAQPAFTAEPATRPPSAGTAGQSPANAPPLQGAAPAGSRVLPVLLERQRPGPLRWKLANGANLYVDAWYHSAWLDLAPESLRGRIATLTGEVMPATPGEMAEIQKSSASHQVSVEQLCWMGESTSETASMVERWFQEDNAIVRLETWPNLSLQADNAQWLQVLGALRRQPRALSQALALATGAGLAPARARYGFAMLFMFRHASLTRAPVAAAEQVFAPEPATYAAQARDAGVFGRLRSRLRSLIG